MLGHHFDLADGAILSLARSLFDLRQNVPEDISLQSFISSSHVSLSEKSSPPLAGTILRLAQLFDGGRLTEKKSHWVHTFDLFLLHLFHKYPSLTTPPPDLDRLHIITCLEIMNESLRFNLCKFPSSSARNNDVLDLKALASSNISSHLRYACRNWTRCIPRLKILDNKLLKMLREFFRTHFLHWLEVMSILALSPVEALTNIRTARVCNSRTRTAVIPN